MHMSQADSSFPVRSQTARVVTFKIIGTDETMQFPCVVSTTGQEAIDWLCQATLVQEERIKLYHKQGAYYQRLVPQKQLQPVMLIKGIKNFKPEVKEWPHPICILGSGYHGMKTAMTYMNDGYDNLVIFDRNEVCGGYCWLTGANKTSRLQTEFGAFHIWWGPDSQATGRVDYPNCNIPHEKGGWHIWPYKKEMQKMFKYVSEAYGLEAFTHYSCNVLKCKVEGNKDAEERNYNLNVKKLKDDTNFEAQISVMYNYPGSLTQNRIVEYPGEDEFDGEVRYGMNDDTPYDKLKGAKVVILGNGAFSVENARTVVECGGTKAYIITRRKNLASPRMPCWFVHQGPLPVPGALLIKMFEPMYNACGFGDPWTYFGVNSNEKRTNVRILQGSRFGIGDVTFLMTAWGLLEWRETTLKRCSHHTCHLSTGEALEGVTVILKALGLLADYSFDKLHNIKEMVGMYVNGDYRRNVYFDATGMDAANFSTFSAGSGTTEQVLTMKYIYDFPSNWHQAVSYGMMNMMPKHKEEPELEKPAYMVNMQFLRNAGMAQGSFLQKAYAHVNDNLFYKYKMYHISHNFERTWDVALSEWDAWQARWKSEGIEHDYTPYPYTKEIMTDYFTDYNARVNCMAQLGFDSTIDGPDESKDYAFNNGSKSHLEFTELTANEKAIEVKDRSSLYT